MIRDQRDGLPETVRPLLLSDVDDTLLDDRTPLSAVVAAWAAAAPRVEIVLASSRTGLELLHLLEDLEADADLIAENGASVMVRSPAVARALGASDSIIRRSRRWFIAAAGAPVDEVLATFREVRARHGARVKLAQELPPSRRMSLMGHDRAKVQRALARRHSLLIEVPPPGSATPPWLEEMRSLGYQAMVGGRWLTIWKGPDKGTAAQAYLAARAAAGLPEVPVAAIGDAANDVPLLMAATTRFVVRDATGAYHPALAAVPGTVRLRAAGHAGWRRATGLLARISHPAVTEVA